MRTFSKLIEAQSFLAVGEMDDVNNLSWSHRQVFASELLYDAVRIHHHGVHRSEGPIVLGNKKRTSGVRVTSFEQLRQLENIFIRLLKETEGTTNLHKIEVLSLVF